MARILIALLFPGLCFADTLKPGTEEAKLRSDIEKIQENIPYVIREPYVPPTWDYGVELGSLFAGSDNYWMGLSAGKHISNCILVSTETCQQYIDLIGGVAGRQSYTHYMVLLSPRWQYVNWPTHWATHLRLLAGGVHSITPGEVYQRPLFGVGGGLTMYLHPKADFRVEARVGSLNGQPWGQVFMSVQFKMDKVVVFFAEKLKDLGVGAVEASGQALKTGVEVTGKVLETTATTTGKVVGTTVRETAKGVKRAGEATGFRKKDGPVAGVATPTPTPTPSATPAPVPKQTPSSKIKRAPKNEASKKPSKK